MITKETNNVVNHSHSPTNQPPHVIHVSQPVK